MPRNMVRVRGGAPSQQYQAPKMRLGRSQFDLSKNHKTTFNVGDLVPYFLTEVVPGDTHTVRLMSFLRIFSPLDAPIMDNIHIGIDYFYVPCRLIWENWEKFLGASDEAGAQDTDYTIPILQSGTTIVHSRMGQYFGLPVGMETADPEVNALPFRAFRLIYNEWYRDQNIRDKIEVPLGDGPDTPAQSGVVGSMLKSAKKPDYFTTALPFLQKGDPIGIDLGTVEVRTNQGQGDPLSIFSTAETGYRRMGIPSADLIVNATTGAESHRMYTDLPAVNINALREAAALQRLLERDARGGTRHPEIIRAHFGVDVPDMRTQRPEYLGGATGFINVSPVANTSATANEDQGQLTGVGTGTLRGGFAKSFVEHGYIIGILRARGEISYQQGLDRMWSRSTKYEFLWPELAQLGEQPIYNKEIFASGVNSDEVFGYQERYAEYRFGKSLVTGKFASDVSGSLDYWHLAEDFASLPSLNLTFIQDQTPMARVVTVDSEPHFIIDGRFDHRVARPLPVRPVPTLAPARF